MIRATVLTSVMDDYDTLKPILAQDGAQVDWVCFTDSEKLRREAQDHAIVFERGPHGDWVTGIAHPTGWEIVYYARPADEHPNRAAKKPKVEPRMFTDAPFSVWLDASFAVVSPRFVVDTVTLAAESDSGVAQFKHPWRGCLFDEAAESMGLPKYHDERAALSRQMIDYAAAGMPHDWGLWATGVIARRHSAPVIDWGHVWAREIRRHSFQDQISHPYACWRNGIRPVNLPGNHLGNQWLSYEGSGRH